MSEHLAVFDLDETLDHPSVAKMLLALHASPDFQVAVLSGGLTPVEHKKRQLRYLGIPGDVPLYVMASKERPVVADAKARWLKENGAAIFVDDDHLFCDEAHVRNPRLVVLQLSGPRAKRSSHEVE